MFIKSSEYNGETIIKLSALVQLAFDLLAAIQEVSDDKALLADLDVVISDLQDIIASLSIMELPGVYKGIHSVPPDEQA